MLTRRALCVDVPLAVAMAAVAESRPAKFGRVTVSGWVAHKQRTGKALHVYVDGKDVTWDCQRADDIRGYAVCLKRDENGHAWVAPNGRIAKSILRGDVRIVEQEA